MRVWIVALAVGCSFSPTPPSMTTPGDAAHHPDAAPDAPPDAKVCPGTYALGSATATYRFTVNLTWDAAEAECASDGNHLVDVGDGSEDAFLTALLPGSGFFWIGLHDAQMTDTYVWTDGAALGYTNFSGSGIPKSTTKDCVDKAFGGSGQWTDWYCDPQPQGQPLEVGLCECDP